MKLDNMELDELRIRPSGNRPTDNSPNEQQTKLPINHTYTLAEYPQTGLILNGFAFTQFAVLNVCPGKIYKPLG